MLARPGRPERTVTLVPLIDVLFILLVYFMVTSVYLDLNMIPASGSSEDVAEGGNGASGAMQSSARLVRLDRDGRAVMGGVSVAVEDLAGLLADEVAKDPDVSVMILPSPYAPVQSLATALDAVASAGVRTSRILNLEAGQ